MWVKKERLFSEQARLLGMEPLESVPANDPRAMLLMTYSGSLVSLGYGAGRWLEYASIKIRADVPDVVRTEETGVAGEIRVGSPVRFTGGPVKQTSALHLIVAPSPDVASAEQEKRVREATIFLTDSFVRLHRDLTSGGDADLDRYDKRSVVAYLAKKNGLTRKKVDELLDDYLFLLEAGLLSGRPMPVGRLGRLKLNLKPSRKARLIKNPSTGEEMTIPARDAQYAPSFKFSARVKERAAAVPNPEEGAEGE
jgi:nucleoid DNA-binding protein